MRRMKTRRSLAVKFLFIQIVFLLPVLLLFAYPTPARAAGCSGTMDYGDAPSSHGCGIVRATSNPQLGSIASTAMIKGLHGFASTAANGDDTNTAADGEIEDHPLTIGAPAAVILSFFAAQAALPMNDPSDMVVSGLGIGAAGAILLMAGLEFLRKWRDRRRGY